MPTPGTQLSPQARKQLRGIAHHLHPVVSVGEGGLSDGVREETLRALRDHELIKVRFSGDRRARASAIADLAAATNAEVVQTIGKVAVLYRALPDGH